MEIKQIESKLLPELNGTTKDLINNGIWFLYRIDKPPVEDGAYCLIADKPYILDSKGHVIKVATDLMQSLTYKERLMFSDMPKSFVQENCAIKWV